MGFGDFQGSEGEGAVWGEFEAELMGEAAHGPTGVDLADAMPLETFFGAVEKGVDAEGAEVIAVFEELCEGGGEVFFGFGEDGVGDETRLFRRERAGGFGMGCRGDPLTFGADFLMRKAEEADAALLGFVDLEEQGKLEFFFEPGF